MVWKEKMEEKKSFVLTCKSGFYSMSETCRRYGVSRVTGYLWWNRYKEHGLEGLEERSRAPRGCPHQTPAETLELILAIKMAAPFWGAPKIRAYMQVEIPGKPIPSVSTIHQFLNEMDLVKHRRGRPGWRHPGRNLIDPDGPNDIWTTDFKGQFKMLDGAYCYPLTVCDQFSRYVLDVTGLPSTKNVGVKPVFIRLFKTYGMPRAIHSDNGVPFCTNAIHGFSELSIWWLKLGIRHSRMRPSSPQENGAHERMHRTLKAETARPGKANMALQQVRFDEWRKEFNEVRPHEFLENDTPSMHYTPSPRRYTGKLLRPEYPNYFIKKRITKSGDIRIGNRLVYVSQLLSGDYVGLEEIQDGVWSIYYYDLLLGRADERGGRLKT